MVFRIFSNKRGMAEGISVIRVMILILIISIPVITLGVVFAKAGKSSGVNEACRLSIIVAAKTKIATTLVADDTLHVECPAEQITIKKRDISKGLKVNWDLANSVLAREIYNCYVKTAGGKYNPFEKTWGEDNFCLVCSHITFKGLPENAMLPGTKLYLAVKRVPGQKMSFYEAAYGKPVDTDLLRVLKTSAESGADAYLIDKPYVVIWRASKEALWDESAIGAAAGAAGGAAAAGIAYAAGTVFIVSNPVGWAVGAGIAVGAIVAGVVFWLSDEDIETSEHLIVPEALLSATEGDAAKGIGMVAKNPEREYCQMLIDTKT